MPCNCVHVKIEGKVHIVGKDLDIEVKNSINLSFIMEALGQMLTGTKGSQGGNYILLNSFISTGASVSVSSNSITFTSTYTPQYETVLNNLQLFATLYGYFNLLSEVGVNNVILSANTTYTFTWTITINDSLGLITTLLQEAVQGTFSSFSLSTSVSLFQSQRLILQNAIVFLLTFYNGSSSTENLNPTVTFSVTNTSSQTSSFTYNMNDPVSIPPYSAFTYPVTIQIGA